MTPKTQPSVCRPDQHDFVPKHTKTIINTEHTVDVSEVFCRKCGTVCFLTSQEPAAEPSRITLARASN